MEKIKVAMQRAGESKKEVEQLEKVTAMDESATR